MAEKLKRQQLELEQQVIVTSSEQDDRIGIIKYLGPVTGQPGTWVGIELEKDEGKHDGSYNGQRYFECADKHGIFVRAHQIKQKEEQSQQSKPKEEQKKTSSVLKQPGVRGLRKPQISTEDQDGETSTTEKKTVLKKPVGQVTPKVTPASPTKKQQQPEESGSMPVIKESRSNVENEEVQEEIQSSKLQKKEPKKEEPANKETEQSQALKESASKKNITQQPQKQPTHPEKEELKYEAKAATKKQPSKATKQTPQSLSFQKPNRKDEENESMKALREQLQLKDERLKQQEEEIEHISMEKELQEANVETLQLELENANATIEELNFQLEQQLTEQEQMTQMNIQETDKDQLILIIKKLTVEQQSQRIAYDKKIESLEKEINALQEYEEQAALMGDVLNQVAQKEELIASLQEQLDEASEYQQLIEQLSESNQKKDEQIEELDAKNKEMEELLDMQEKVAEDTELLQQDLYNDISMKEVEIANLQAQQQIFEEEKSLLNVQIERFKEKINELNNSLTDSRNTIEKVQEASQDAQALTVMYEKMQWYAAQQKSYLANRIHSGIQTIKSQFQVLKSQVIAESLPESIFSRLGIPCFNKIGLLYELKNLSLNLFLEIVSKENNEKTLNPALANILKLLNDLYKASDNLYYQVYQLTPEQFLKIHEETYWGKVQALISGLDMLAKLFIDESLTNQVNIETYISMSKELMNISKEKPRSLKIEVISKIMEIIATYMQSEQLQINKVKNLITNLQNINIPEQALQQTLGNLNSKIQEGKWIDQELNFLSNEIEVGEEAQTMGPWDQLSQSVKQQIERVQEIQKERDDMHAKYKEIAQQYYSVKKEFSEQQIINKSQEKRLQETINKAGKSIELQAEIDQQKEQITKYQKDIENLQSNLQEKINQITELKQQQSQQQPQQVKKSILIEQVQSPKFKQMPMMANIDTSSTSSDSQIEILKVIQQEKIVLQSERIRNIMDTLPDLLKKKEEEEVNLLQKVKNQMMSKMANISLVSLKSDVSTEHQFQKQQDDNAALRLQAHKLGIDFLKKLLPEKENHVNFFTQNVITKKVVDRMTATQKIGEIRILSQKQKSEELAVAEPCKVKVQLSKDEVQELHLMLVP